MQPGVQMAGDTLHRAAALAPAMPCYLGDMAMQASSWLGVTAANDHLYPVRRILDVDVAVLQRADAVELARRKLPSGPALQAQLADRQAKQKLIRRMVSALARKGYAPGLAFEVVRGVLEDHGTGDDGLLEEPESL